MRDIQMQPGIYYGIPYTEYHRIDAVSATRLKWIRESPLLYRYLEDHGGGVTDAMGRGSICHTATLEPDKLAETYAIWPATRDGKKTVRRGKAWDQFCADNAGRDIVRESDLEAASGVARSVRAHDVAKRYISGGHAEVSIVWRDEQYGVMCKARIDYLHPDAYVELKTSVSVEPRLFLTTCAQMGYHLQIAHYYIGCRALDLGDRPYKAIAVESTPPHDVVVYDVPDATIVSGELARNAALETLIRCEQTNTWPGIAPDREEQLLLPAWATDGDDAPLTFGGQEMEF